MADKATNSSSVGADPQEADAIDSAADDLAELDSLVSDLVGEINGAADEISRVMADDDEPSPDAALSDDGATAPANAPKPASEDAISDAADDLDDDVGDAMDATGIDEALERVAASMHADLDEAEGLTRPDGASPHAPTDEDDPAGDPGEESIAAQIDEELAKALGEDDEPEPDESAETPAPAAPEADESEPEEDESDPDPEAETAADEDEDSADPQATDDAVNAVAEAIDRLLDEETAEDSSDPTDPESEPENPDAPEAEDEVETPAAPAPPPAPTKPKAKPAPAAAPAPLPESPAPGRKWSAPALAIAALTLINKPFERLPEGLRDTLGFAGLVTLFNAACLWVFLLIR